MVVLIDHPRSVQPADTWVFMSRFHFLFFRGPQVTPLAARRHDTLPAEPVPSPHRQTVPMEGCLQGSYPPALKLLPAVTTPPTFMHGVNDAAAAVCGGTNTGGVVLVLSELL